MNTFGYVGGNPLTYIDSNGLNGKKPSDSAHCNALRNKIKNIWEDFFGKIYPALQNNPKNLKFFTGPGEKLSDSVKGYETLINKIFKSTEVLGISLSKRM